MKIFIDDARIEKINEALSWGIVDGITTNPSLIKKAVDELKQNGNSISIEEYIENILEAAGKRPVSLEVIGLTEERMYNEGKRLYDRFNPVSGNVVVKIPVNPSECGTPRTYDGLKAIKRLSSDGIPINCTLIFTPEQALLAAKAGACYLSPFVGRIDDGLRKSGKIEFKKEEYYPPEGKTNEEGETLNDNGIVSGVDLIKKTVTILNNYDLKAEIIAASVRNPQQMREIALAGSHIATVPYNTLEKMLCHPQTEQGVEQFVKDVVSEYRAIF